ncbi:MAG: NUDIX hydrolase [Promethearchaeota archaeon]|nr:MAG: NUDIX hydrolase [Candidatus Lokiarchaeota archaeon]
MSLQFIENEQFWYVSAFLDSSKLDGWQISAEIERLIKAKLDSLTDNDIYRKELKEDLFEMVKNVSIVCKWVPYLESFPYRDENSDYLYNTLGYFEFEVNYYQNDLAKKESLSPMLIQQIPYIVLNSLKKYDERPENKALLLDTESPIYVFATSYKTVPQEVQWTQENIEKYKKVIGDWTEIYSGQWEDYSEKLYNRRVQNNLSNRLSELHFIHRNSGFIYMAEYNYKKFFESYMKPFVLDPTPRMRAVLFALRSINESLDLLFLKTQLEAFQDLEAIERKTTNLRLLRGLIQTNLSTIYNELDYNRRQHYTTILKHLLNEFDIQDVVSRLNKKFNLIYDAIQVLYQKKNEENQQRTERGLSLLNLLFGAGVLADLAGLIMITFAMQEGAFGTTLLNGLIASIIIIILIITIGYYFYAKRKINKAEVKYTIDAVITTEEGGVILIKRKYPPFRDYYALPGGFIQKGETTKHALFREVKEETNLNVEIVGKIGYYDEEGRDPRGRVESTAFKCVIIGDPSEMRSGDDSKQVEIISKDRLNTIELAFDHAKILRDAGVLK